MTTTTLDFRVTVLEDNGGGNGNSSVAELEVRVETLEETAADHETRISTTEFDVTGNLAFNHVKWRKFITRTIWTNYATQQNDAAVNTCATFDISCKTYSVILDLEGTVADQETRLTAAEENIQGWSIFRYGPSHIKLSFDGQRETCLNEFHVMGRFADDRCGLGCQSYSPGREEWGEQSKW